MLKSIQKMTAVTAAMAAFGVIVYFLIISGPLHDLDAAERRHEALRHEYTDAVRASANIEALRLQLVEVQNLNKALRTMLPDDDGAQGGHKFLDNAIRAAAAKAGLESSLELSIGNSLLKDFYGVRPFSIRVNGDFRSVVNFLQHVSTGSEQLRVLKQVSVQPRWSTKGIALALEAEAFTYLTDDSLAASRRTTSGSRTRKPE